MPEHGGGVCLTIVSICDSRLRCPVKPASLPARWHAIHCRELARPEAQQLVFVLPCVPHHPDMPDARRPRPSLPGGEAEHVHFCTVGAQGQNLFEGPSRTRCFQDKALSGFCTPVGWTHGARGVGLGDYRFIALERDAGISDSDSFFVLPRFLGFGF